VGFSAGVGTGDTNFLDGMTTRRPMCFGVMRKMHGVHGRGPMGLSHDERKGGKARLTHNEVIPGDVHEGGINHEDVPYESVTWLLFTKPMRSNPNLGQLSRLRLV
jgi:hypothetical protein